MKKGGFLLFLIISLALTAFLAGYIMVRRGADAPSSSKTGTILDRFGDQETGDKKQEETIEETRPTLITERRVLSVVNSYNKGAVLYFEKNTGKLFELDLETKAEKPVLDKSLVNFISAVWSPTKNEFIGSFISNSGIVFKYFNISTGEEVNFDPNIRSVAFSPDGNLIAYHSLNEAAGSNSVGLPDSQAGKIVISEPDGKYQKKILNTRLENIKMSWPTKDKMAFVTSNSEMFLVTEDGKLTKVLELKPGLYENWSPSGRKLLFSVSSINQEQPDTTLNIKNLESKEEREIAKSSASKCVWSIDDINVFCAISKSPSIDEIYKINTLDGSQKLVAEPLTGVREILLSPLEERLVFVDASDEKLYSIKIAE